MIEIVNTNKGFVVILSDNTFDTGTYGRIVKAVDFKVEYYEGFGRGKRVALSVTQVTKQYPMQGSYISTLSEPFATGNFNVTLEPLQRKNMKRVDVWLAKVMTVRDQIVELYNAGDYQGVADLVQSL